ncbi:hypothetical protein GCM10027258_39690 [Amycolatopsis stemonae]
MGRKAKTRRRRALLVLLVALLLVRGVVRLVTAHPFVSTAGGLLLVLSVLVALLARLRLRQRAWRRQLAQAEQAGRHSVMDPAEFERALALLCARDGCVDVAVTGGSGDLGADVIARSPTGARIVLQAKRYALTTKVSGPDLQRFGGTCFTVHHADIAAVVTTSTFTTAARDYARLAGIRLFDATALAAWASRTGPPPWHPASAPSRTAA